MPDIVDYRLSYEEVKQSKPLIEIKSKRLFISYVKKCFLGIKSYLFEKRY